MQMYSPHALKGWVGPLLHVWGLTWDGWSDWHCQPLSLHFSCLPRSFFPSWLAWACSCCKGSIPKGQTPVHWSHVGGYPIGPSKSCVQAQSQCGRRDRRKSLYKSIETRRTDFLEMGGQGWVTIYHSNPHLGTYGDFLFPIKSNLYDFSPQYTIYCSF